MSRTKQASKRKRGSKAVPVLGAAGLSLALAGAASASTGGAAVDQVARNTAVRHEIALREEEISDVSLATFYVVDKESTAPVRPRGRLAMGACGGCGCGGCGGCWTGTYYTTSVAGSEAHPPHHPIKPAHKHRHAAKRTHVPKKP